jgi:molecular chaperone HtpG
VTHVFQVDLRGVVDLLSQHLYTSPQVYVRELLQNAVDAITARRAADPDAPAEISLTPTETSLDVVDTGIGLTEAQVHELLATIGRSSKRDELGFARHEFLGQFGIGLLSCFMVADEIRVGTRCGDAPTAQWTGRSDGSYAVALAAAGQQRAEPGTAVTLVPRPGSERWLSTRVVTDLARHYGEFLPFPVQVAGAAVTGAPAPWDRPDGETGTARRARLNRYAEEVFGFTPFAVIDLAAAEAGLTGVAFVLPAAASPAAHAAHRVYLKRMLLTGSAEGLLPDWAFFVRCVVDSTELRPTASREALYEDSLLESVRERLGDRVRGWLVGLAGSDPRQLAAFLRIHHLGVKALALHDDDMLRLVAQWWPMETNVGPMTIAEFVDRYGVLRYAPGVDEFRRIAAVAAAQGVPVVNAGYVYDEELIARLPLVETGVTLEQLGPGDLATRLDGLASDQELALRPFLATAQRALDRLGCEVIIRAFEPVSLPALYLLDAEVAFQQELRSTRDEADDVWGAILGEFESSGPSRPQLVLNHRNPLVRQVLSLADGGLAALAVEGLYVQALLLGHHPLRPVDTAALNQSFLGLITRAIADADRQ